MIKPFASRAIVPRQFVITNGGGWIKKLGRMLRAAVQGLIEKHGLLDVGQFVSHSARRNISVYRLIEERISLREINNPRRLRSVGGNWTTTLCPRFWPRRIVPTDIIVGVRYSRPRLIESRRFEKFEKKNNNQLGRFPKRSVR